MKQRVTIAILFSLLLSLPLAAASTPAKDTKDQPKPGAFVADSFSGLTLRNIGPAVASGRVSDVAVVPNDHATMYVTAASGGVWKTVNSGTTWTPVFDKQGSYSIGCITLDPNDPLVVWVGTGENNSQRSVAYGDGVYKSTDGGKTWKNMGLGASEHIGKILVDPRDSNVVYVAAQGPLWNAGGDRGLYKTTDGGKTWKKVLEISENTGVSDIAFDPRNQDVIYATSYQRRRHVWTLIDGGPEGAIYKSRDAGASWDKINKGLPDEDIGRIGIAVSPVDPDVVYALVEAANGKSGFFRSTDAGGSWEHRSDYSSTSPQYYQELFADPKNVDRVYSMDTWMQVTQDGGKTFKRVGENAKHVDNHALWIDPTDTDHLVAGCDGGLYESYDRGATWRYFSNLPLMQFYDVTTDNSLPFYYVYGGTQDNNTLGGPSRTTTDQGIMNSDWYVTTGGDGFQSRVDPGDPNIVYSESQYGGLVRYDRKSGETIDIRPVVGKGEEPLRFNWDSPIIISPHSNTRLYFGANRLYRSDDRGNSWKPVSADLTKRVDRNKLKVMGRVWPPDAVAKNTSTSFYGNIVALSESPKQEGLIYAGTDDGTIQVTTDGGASWTMYTKFAGVPDSTYVSRLFASQYDASVVYATFDNHKMGDFKPYVLKSRDKGKTWTSVTGDLPARGSVYAFVEDTLDSNLLFAGTEFGLFFTRDGGSKWVQLKGGLPTIAIRDLTIQKRDDALVAASFGRGFYILDDLGALRRTTPELLQKDSQLFPIDQKVWLYVPATPLGLKGKSFQGDAFYIADNPPYGAVFTYYLKDDIKTLKKQRLESYKDKTDIQYPTWEALRSELREEEPAVILTVTDEDGNVVRRISGPADAGFHRVAWDLRFPSSQPTELKSGPEDPFSAPPRGPLAAPGNYKVSMATWVNGVFTPVGETQSFAVTPLGMATLPATDNTALLAFQRKTAALQRAVMGAEKAADEAQTRLDYIKKALVDTPGADPKLFQEALSLQNRLKDIQIQLSGDSTIGKYNEPTPVSISERVQGIVEGGWASTSSPTQTHQQSYAISAEEFAPILENLRKLIEVDLKSLEDRMETLGAPWTPGRVPQWKP